MRPQSISMFDKLFFASILVGVINTVISWGTIEADLAGSGMGIGVVITGLAAGWGISFLLWYFISRKASNVARWIWIVLTVLGLVFVPFALFDIPVLEMVLTLVATALQIAMIYFLFQPDAKAYFENRGQPSVDPTVFE